VGALKGDLVQAPASFDVDTMIKDLRYMADEAAAQGKSLPLASRALECFDSASRGGGGGVDGADYPAYWVAQQRAVAALSTRTKH
jgi:3-hydroxyisobutyrate dehydrogenase-like beta-hydroxyacid dehydrogenase